MPEYDRKPCAVCGRDFEPRSGRQMTCPGACARERRRRHRRRCRRLDPFRIRGFSLSAEWREQHEARILQKQAEVAAAEARLGDAAVMRGHDHAGHCACGARLASRWDHAECAECRRKAKGVLR